MKEEYFVHKTAEVSADAQIGGDAKIWNNVQVREKSIVGRNTILSKDVYVDTGVMIGSDCKIQNSVSIYQGVTIEDDVFVGPNVAFTNDKIPRAFNSNWTITKTLVKKGASIGSNATIVCGIELGEYSMVGAGSVVTKNVPPYTLVIGNPARVVCKIDKTGNKLSD